MLKFDIDQQALLNLYRISSLQPSKWEEIDEGADSGQALGVMNDDDPLGLVTEPSWRDLDEDRRATTLLTSVTFDPIAYLSLAHPQAGLHDLARGVTRLERVLEAREGAVRVLVGDNFGRFVVVKGATEALYEEMKHDVLSLERDHATRPLFDHLRSGAQKGNQIFLPVLETSANAERLRTTFTVFERSKFFFNLPSFIMESIATGHYELALRDYKKGKYILQNRPGQLLPISQGPAAAASATTRIRAQEQQARVLDKVWRTVERAMVELKQVLVAQLMDTGRTSEEQDKALETLMEIPADEDPLWIYFDYHHASIMNALTIAERKATQEIDYVLQTLGAAESAEDTSRIELQTAVDYLYAKRSDAALAQSSTEVAWNAIFELVRSVSEVIASSLPTFWRISKVLIRGKIKRNLGAGAKRSPTQCRTMALDIVNQYILLISRFFVLSELVVMAAEEKNSTAVGAHTYPLRLPGNSHSLCTAYHMQRIFSEVQDCVSELTALDISAEVRNGLASLVDSVKWRFVDFLTNTWIRDATMFYYLETWIACWDAASSSTRYLVQFELFQKHMMTAAYRIATGGETALPNNTHHTRIPQELTTKITNTAFEATHRFLDGLVLLASEGSPIVQNPIIAEGAGSMEMSLHELVDLKDANNRLLIVISNIARFSKQDVPGMIAQLESVFGLVFTEQKNCLAAVLEELDDDLFERYTEPRMRVFKALLKEAVLQSGIDWYHGPLPTAIRPQIFKILNFLVEIHAHLCTITPALLRKILGGLVIELVAELSQVFRQVPRFGVEGLLTAIMDVAFLQKSLASYGRDAHIAEAFDRLINKQLREAHKHLISKPQFETGYAATQKIVAAARNITSVHFLCFRHTSEDEEPGLRARRSAARTHLELPSRPAAAR
ncbi:hypothetical protein HYPSUDRAFT_71229 [Hypholoma sublateritium FD-334 SS-4]|uniref:Exocyst complex component SEC5 n=1 Tax=Hypholoma sublateritium (strain FD-334 SS-4) TaxID=945553 RepID=A0A0D2P8L6_HYPSF|nr:hypothetical protein HYPSUDRAFT_71229 [Hypholoma sublateritium FD-334 SS-4]